eukprot:410295-Hanusia_phi.AAC.1
MESPRFDLDPRLWLPRPRPNPPPLPSPPLPPSHLCFSAALNASTPSLSSASSSGPAPAPAPAPSPHSHRQGMPAGHPQPARSYGQGGETERLPAAALLMAHRTNGKGQHAGPREARRRPWRSWCSMLSLKRDSHVRAGATMVAVSGGCLPHQIYQQQQHMMARPPPQQVSRRRQEKEQEEQEEARRRG